ncbi:MAG TPA: PorV/PorQ family protein [Bacteroidota bacterium]|nr:PorV/PorQ family protein [Bacteroidota bacterium]
MKRRESIIFIVLLLLVSSATLVEAQTRKSGINAATFLKVGVGGRQVGLGSAVTSLTGDATNMFWNPAGTALKNDQAQIAFTHNNWIASLKQEALAGSYNLAGIGTIGVGVMSFGIKGIQADRDIYPLGDAQLRGQEIDQATTDTYDYQDLLAQVTYSRYIIDKLAIGVSAKYIHEKIDDQNASAVAFDLGSVYNIGILDWNIGARICNLGSDMKYYDFASPIPLTFSIGTSMTPIRFGSSTSVLFAVDLVKPQDGQQYYYTGMEFNISNMFYIRGGWKVNYSFFGLAGDGIDEGITYGANARPGIRTSLEKGSLGAGFFLPMESYDVGFDYAYTAFTSLNDVHRFTVRFALK